MAADAQKETYKPNTTANAFQFALLISQMAVRLVGYKIVEEVIIKNGLSSHFDIKNGKINIKISLDDPSAINSFKIFLEGIKNILEKAFGSTYTRNSFEDTLERVKGWIQNENDKTILNDINPFKNAGT